MKNNKSLPGPWELSEGDTSLWAISPLNARVKIATIVKHSPMNGIDHAANARLMAAAPELLEELENAVFELEEWMEVFPSGSDNTPDVLKAARAVIRRARAA